MEAIDIKKKDFILICLLLVIAAVMYGVWYFTSEKENVYVQVTVDGKVYETYQTDKDAVYKVETDNGYNVIEVKSGKVSVTDASCPDKICVHENVISSGGQSIICLPNKVVVSVIEKKEKNDKEIDGVVK